MRILFASLFATALLASTACSDDPVTGDDDADDDTTSSSSGRTGSSSGRSSSSGGRSSSSSSGGRSSSSGGGSTSSSGGASGSSSGSSSGSTWPGPSGTAITAGALENIDDLDGELLAHSIATGAADGSFALAFASFPNYPDQGGITIEKRSATGTLVWRKRMQYTPTSAYANLAMDVAGNVYVAGNVAPNSGFTIDGVTVQNVRKATAPSTTHIGECAVVKLGSADGAKGWHGHATLGATVTLAGDNNVECRSLALRDNQLVLSGVFPTKDIVWVQGATSTSASGNQLNTSGNVEESFAISVASDTGAKNSVNVLLGTGGAFDSAGTAIATDGRTLLSGAARGTNVKTGTITHSPGALASRDDIFYPAGFLDFAVSPATGFLRAAETTAATIDPDAWVPQVTALPAAAALFGLALKTSSATSFRPPQAGTATSLLAGHDYFLLTHMATDASPGETRVLDFPSPVEFPHHHVASGADGSVVATGLTGGAVAFGANCATDTITSEGGYLVSFGTTPMAGCKFAIALPAGVEPARAAIGVDGRIFLAGLYSEAATFTNGVTLPAPADDFAPFFVSFVP